MFPKEIYEIKYIFFFSYFFLSLKIMSFFSDSLSASIYSYQNPDDEEILIDKLMGIYIVHDEEIKKNVV